MNIFSNRLHQTIIYIIPLFILLSYSCSKTEYKVTERPYNEIKKFAIAGYGNQDSIKGVITDNEILVYWNSDNQRPTHVRPHISISQAASISPLSDAEVEFSENTVYTVTAEDGSVRTYTLRPVIQQPIPLLHSLYVGKNATDLTWVDTETFHLRGEYFLAAGNQAIKVYAQRLKDGYEFDIPHHIENATPTSLEVSLPEFTTAQDTGWHKVWLKVGELTSGSREVYFVQPTPQNMQTAFTLQQHGQALQPRQELTLDYSFTDNYDGAVTRYYVKNFGTIYVNIQGLSNGSQAYVEVEDISYTDNQVSFKLPETIGQYAGGYIHHFQIRAKLPLSTKPDYLSAYFYMMPDATTTIAE